MQSSKTDRVHHRAAKRESMDICFVPKGDYGQVLKAYAPQSQQPGPVLDLDGKELGRHEGLAFHTVGQRRGLGISSAEPLYVLRLDRGRNAVIVGPESGLMSREAVARGSSFTSQPDRTPSQPFRCAVKIRSSHPGALALCSPLDDGRWHITFDDAQRAITPGQAAVFYDHDECIGGAILDELEA